jgi:hypothetical protein
VGHKSTLNLWHMNVVVAHLDFLHSSKIID